jgi:molybdopterin-binding protein
LSHDDRNRQTCSNRRTVRSSVFCAVHTESIDNDQLRPNRESREEERERERESARNQLRAAVAEAVDSSGTQRRGERVRESARNQLRAAVAEAVDSSGTRMKGSVRRWKLLPSNGSEGRD